MNTKSPLRSLVHRCTEMDITEQLNYLKDENPYQAQLELAALEQALSFFEWEETTGVCLLGCGGYASDGHNDGCLYVGKLVELGLMKIEEVPG